MMMIVDVSSTDIPFGELTEELSRVGSEEIGVQIKCQKEEIFDLMHRI